MSRNRRPASIATVLLATLLLSATAASAQDEAEKPTLRLDRIPSSPAFVGQTRAPAAESSTYSVESLVGGLSTPWALAFLPDGAILLTEYSGSMRIRGTDGKLSDPLTGLPKMSHEGWAVRCGPGSCLCHESAHLFFVHGPVE